MATRKVKRYNGEDDSDVSSFAGTPENESNAGMKEAADAGEAEARGEAILKGMRDSAAESKPASKPAASKPAASKPAAKSTQYGASAKSLGSSLRFGSDKRTTHPEYPEDYKKPTADKARVGRAGQATSAAPGERSTVTRGNQEAANARRAETRSNMMDSAFTRFLKSSGSQRSRPYQKESGMKSGGMTASKRADGIASRGKTRGKIC